jgi:crossover junction endodeoxyribonuclease RuvC
MAVVVREQALDKQGGPRNSRVIEVLHKVVGVADLYAWGLGGRVFDEIHPKTIKKLVANDQLAEKDVVAQSLAQFVGEREYACDDESDAVAVGIAWLLEKGMIDSPYPPPEKQKTTRKKKSDAE